MMMELTLALVMMPLVTGSQSVGEARFVAVCNSRFAEAGQEIWNWLPDNLPIVSVGDAAVAGSTLMSSRPKYFIAPISPDKIV